MSISHCFGLSEFHYSQQSKCLPVNYQPDMLISGHLLLCGMSGTGKSTQSIRLLDAVPDDIEIDVFDAHDELSIIRDAKSCMYSQHTRYGFNPLVLDTNLHTGGVDRQVNFIVSLIRSVTPSFGIRQESVLRYLLTDVYAAAWIKQSDPSSWSRSEITDTDHDRLIAAKQWNELKRYYPTLEDVKSYAKRKITALMIGGDNKTVAAFDGLRRAKSRLQSLNSKYGKIVDAGEQQRAEAQIADQKEKCIECYTLFVTEMKTGREIEDVMKYDSVEVLTSVLHRLDLLSAAGVLCSNPPPFDGATRRIHQILSLDDAQQMLFVKLRLTDIFWRYKRMGATKTGTEIRHVVFIDEGHRFFRDDPQDIINVIAKEGRKFGIALWIADQEPTAFPESFLTSCGATILLGIHSSFWKRTTAMLRITEQQLKYIKPKEVMAVKLQRSGVSDPAFINLIVPNTSNEAGRKSADYAKQQSGRVDFG